MVPPVTLLPNVLTHMEACHAKGTVVVPHWPSAAYYPLLFKDRNTHAPYIKAWEVVPFRKGLLVQGENMECFIGSEQFRSDILVLQVEF